MSKEIIKVVEIYQKARVTFAQTVAELASRPRNIEGVIVQSIDMV